MDRWCKMKQQYALVITWHFLRDWQVSDLFNPEERGAGCWKLKSDCTFRCAEKLISLKFHQILAEASGSSTDGTENMERVLQDGTHLVLLKDLRIKIQDKVSSIRRSSKPFRNCDFNTVQSIHKTRNPVTTGCVNVLRYAVYMIFNCVCVHASKYQIMFVFETKVT